VSVTTICSNSDERRFSNALPDRTACVAAANTRFAPASATACAAALSVPARVDDVVDEDGGLVF